MELALWKDYKNYNDNLILLSNINYLPFFKHKEEYFEIEKVPILKGFKELGEDFIMKEIELIK